MRRKRLAPHRRRIRTICILALSFAVMSGCSETIPLTSNSATQVAAGQEQSLKAVKTATIAKQKIGDPIELTGSVQSSAQFDIIAKSAGDVETVLKARGDTVKEGEVILRMSSSEAKFQREKAALAVQTAEESIRKARERARKDLENQRREMNSAIEKMEQTLVDLTKAYNKAKNDYEVGLATKAQVYQAEVQLKNARFDLEQLKQKQSTLEPADTTSELEVQLKTAQMTLLQVEQTMNYLEVKAPVNGVLTEMPFEAGMSVQQGAKVGLIQKLNPIKIKTQLSEEHTRFVGGKTELTYYVQPAAKNKGNISFLSKVIDPELKSYEMNMDVPNEDMTLKPGMKVRVQLTDEQEQVVLTVPTFSVVKEGEETYVFVLSGDTVEKRKVQLGRTNEPNQEVVSGVKEGERVVTSNPAQLRDKEKVRAAE